MGSITEYERFSYLEVILNPHEKKEIREKLTSQINAFYPILKLEWQKNIITRINAVKELSLNETLEQFKTWYYDSLDLLKIPIPVE